MQTQWMSIIIATLIPSVIGFVWYNPKVFGTAWMNGLGLTEEKLREANMAKIMIISLICSFLMAFFIQTIVIHQMSVYSLLMNEPGLKDPNSELSIWLDGFMKTYGGNFRTFKHGALHGVISGIFFVGPVLMTNALFERKSMKVTFIHIGYWCVTLGAMGAVICHKW